MNFNLISYIILSKFIIELKIGNCKEICAVWILINLILKNAEKVFSFNCSSHLSCWTKECDGWFHKKR